MQSNSGADPISIVKALYAAAARRDIDGMMELGHLDIVAVEADSLPYGGEYRGKNNVRRLFERIGEAFSEYKCSEFQYLANEDTVAVVFRLQAVVRSSGVRVNQELCELWKVAEQKLILCKPFYFDTHAICEALAKPG